MTACWWFGMLTPAIRAISLVPLAYPCRCLWRGSAQMTRTTPLRRMILHLRQIFFTDASTFIVLSRAGPTPRLDGAPAGTYRPLIPDSCPLIPESLRPEHDPCAREVVGSQLDRDLV